MLTIQVPPSQRERQEQNLFEIGGVPASYDGYRIFMSGRAGDAGFAMDGPCLLGLGLAGLMAAPAAAETKRPDKVAFYFAAHEDDWQLFMNPSAFEDVIKGAGKTVFVHVTAGDAGLGMGRGGRKFPFYLARENGAETAIRFMADADATPAVASEQHRVFNGHSIYRVAYRNTVSYFLRVPDGNPQGTGYYDTGYQSLAAAGRG